MQKPVLASGSATRRAMLSAAGLEFDVATSPVDEAALKSACRAAGHDAGETALRLATAKAQAVEAAWPGRIVIGADQMLDCEGIWLDKPEGMAGVEAQLRFLRGRRHHLPTAVVCRRDGETLWQHLETPKLTLCAFPEADLAFVLAAEGEALLGSVGGYRVEGPAIRLFETIRGDWFSVLGLPLLPLLGFLRQA